jgi:Ca-activated chloride channel homolog
MPHVLTHAPRIEPAPHASNGARLVSFTGKILPLRHITLVCDATGGIARTKLRQHFRNEYRQPLELVYTFPLPADGAVSGYEICAGERLIKGRIERRADARSHYETARLDGRTAGLVEQARSNVFTQLLGNIRPLTDVTVELTIDQPLQWIAGHGWEWRFPTVVAPRYVGAKGVVPDAARVTVDVVNGVTPATASVTLTISEDLAGTPTSSTHPIVAANQTVTLVAGAALDRDIVIRWRRLADRPRQDRRRRVGTAARREAVSCGRWIECDSGFVGARGD